MPAMDPGNKRPHRSELKTFRSTTTATLCAGMMSSGSQAAAWEAGGKSWFPLGSEPDFVFDFQSRINEV